MRLPAPRSPRAADGRFVNWAGTVTTTPTRWCEPRDDAELGELVRGATRAGQRVRAVGAGHSWSPIAAADDVAVCVDRLSGVRRIDRARSLAVVGAGTRLRALNEALDEHGLALPIVGSVDHQSVAGAIATGTHGSSLVHGNLSSLVQAVRMVTGQGEIVDLDATDERLEGARVHLGALGILAEVTLRVIPAFKLAVSVESVPLHEVGPRIESIAHSAEYVKLWWIPHTARAHVFRYERTDDPESRRPSPRTLRWIDEVLLQGGVYRAVLAVEQLEPRWIPAIHRTLAKTFEHGRRVGTSYVMLGTPMPLIHRETEAALPMSRAAEAFDRLVHLIEREKLFVNFIAEMRFVRGDAAWMSPAQGVDTCQLGAYMVGTTEVDRYFAAFWREMRALDARPHWGKEHDFALDEVRERFALLPRFRALRDELDPDRTFATPFHARVLGA